MNDKPWVLTHDSGQTQSVNVDGPFLANNRGFLYQLAIDGHGIAQSASTWVAKDLHAETLVQVLPDWTSPTAVAYAVTTTRLLPAKVRVFLDFLSSRLDLEASLLSPLD
jgi:DNA-binding transcriptional LysR family regulator